MDEKLLAKMIVVGLKAADAASGLAAIDAAFPEAVAIGGSATITTVYPIGNPASPDPTRRVSVTTTLDVNGAPKGAPVVAIL